ASNVMPPTSADTATAPRIRQYEQVQRRALLNPSVNFTRKRTGPQWHAASLSSISFACLLKLPNLTKSSLFRAAENYYFLTSEHLLSPSGWAASSAGMGRRTL